MNSAPVPSASTRTPSACPQCAAPIATDPRVRAWCPACEWNLADPPTSEHLTALGRRWGESRRRAVGARVDRAFALAAADAPAHRDLSLIGAYLLAGLVHLFSLAIAVGSVLMILTDHWVLRVLGAIGLATAVSLRPRFGSFKKQAVGAVPRAEAPALYALVDRVSAALGARPVDAILLDGEFTASYGTVGLRRKSVLTVGLPLWYVLTPQQRVALLGHEIGHGVNRDSRRGVWLHSATFALEEWYRIIGAGTTVGEGGLLFLIGSWVLALIARALNLGLYGLVHAMELLTNRAGQLAEYRADRLAAQVGSAPAMAGTLALLLHGETVESAIVRHRASIPRQIRGRAKTEPVRNLWDDLAAACEGVPPLERERQLRLSARELGSVDRTHPPTHLRIRLMEQQPASEPAVRVEDAEPAAIEAELAPYRKRVERELTAG